MHIFERHEDSKTYILYFNVLQLHTLDANELVSIEDIKIQQLYKMVINESGWTYRKGSGTYGRHTGTKTGTSKEAYHRVWERR